MKNTLRLFSFFLFTFICLIPVSFAEQKVVTAEGKYVMGDLDSRKDAKALALIDAKRMALEQAGTYLESATEVKNYQLNKDQVNSLAAGIMSVDVLSEDWKQSGEVMTVFLKIKATIDTANLQDRIVRMKENEQAESYKQIQNELALLQKELVDMKAALKAPEPQATPKPAESTTAEKPAETPTAQTKPEPPAPKKPPTPEMKQRYETALNNVNALECLERGNIALTDQRWNDALYVLDKAIELNPNMVDAYAGKSLALYNLDKAKDALPVVNKALELNPQSAGSLGIKALILKDQPGKIKLAQACANSAVTIKPDSPRLLRIRGEVYAKMGKIKLAYQDFTNACDMGSKFACDKAKKIKR